MEVGLLRRRLFSFMLGGMVALGAAAGAFSAHQAAYADEASLASGTARGGVLSAEEASDTVTLKDGTFTGTRYGYRSDVTMAVTVEGGKIVSVECLSQEEDEAYWDKAQVLINQILDEQSTDLDTISGATVSSRAILRAAQSAIDQSSGNDSSKPVSDIFAGGDGTRANPFLIETADQFRAFAKSLTNTVDYEGYYVKLNADVDVSGADWTPVGWAGENGMLQFQGDFDGGNHVISGLTFGTEQAPMEVDANHREVGLFGITGAFAKVHDFDITGLEANISCPTTTHFGAVVANTKPPAGGTVGTFIDGVSVKGSVDVSTAKGTQRVGGIVGYQNRGTVIMNSWTDVDVTVTDCPSWVQVGAISGISNGGLVVNCYSLGDVNAYGASENKVAASLVSGNYGDAVNNYVLGNIVTNVASDCIGAVAGELAEGSAYNNWYNQASTLTVGENAPVELPAVGEVNTTGDSKGNYISDDGLTYNGHLIEGNKAIAADQLEELKDALNASFASFPMDIENLYGVPADALRTWVVSDGVVTFADDTKAFKHSQPKTELVPQATLTMQDGTWYGRDADKITTVKIVTKDNKVESTEVVSGSNKASDISNARIVARNKAIYGDASAYGEADASQFAGGSGTAQDPYLISNEKQLRYIAEAINEDVDWNGVYFKQTEDIDLSSAEWLPIGYMIQGYYHSKWQTFASYPFKGNYDGGNHAITGLRIGSKEAPSTDPRVQAVAGFIGYAVGEVSNNYALKEDSVVRELKNVVIKDAVINTAGSSNVYAAALIAYANNGFTIDHCKAQGTVVAGGMESTIELTDYAGEKSTTTASTKNIYAGGVFGYGLRGGLIKDTAADVDVNAAALEGSTTVVYAGGLFGMDNRTTAINAYASGDVAASAAQNRAYVGGLTGYSAGAHYNVYTSGAVSSKNPSDYVGGTSGTFKMVGGDFKVFYNADAAQTVAGVAKAEPSAYGTQDADAVHADSAAKSAAELASAAFADVLNDGVKSVSTVLPAQISEDPIHYSYYVGDGSDLKSWIVSDGMVVLADAAENAITGIESNYSKVGNVSKATSFVLSGKALGGTLSYASNSKFVTVDAKGKVTIAKNFTGIANVTAKSDGDSAYGAVEKQVSILVKPGKMAVGSAKNVKPRSVNVAWKKMAGADKYQVRVATDKKMKKGVKTSTAKAAKSSLKIAKLKKGKTYYAQVRAYDKQSKSWGAWSKAKKVKVAK